MNKMKWANGKILQVLSVTTMVSVSGIAPLGEVAPASGDSAAKAEVVTKQFSMTIPDYSQTPDDKVEEITDDIENRQSAIQHLLLWQLQRNKLSNASKAEIINLLGSLHAYQATGELIKNINFADTRSSGVLLHIGKRRGYVARAALVELGVFASDEILGVIGFKQDKSTRASEYGFDASKIDGFAEVLSEIESRGSVGARYALLKLQDRQDAAKDPEVKAQFQMVIDRVKKRKAEMERIEASPW